jgi:hypothetical protein
MPNTCLQIWRNDDDLAKYLVVKKVFGDILHRRAYYNVDISNGCQYFSGLNLVRLSFKYLVVGSVVDM